MNNLIYSNMHDILNKYINEELPRQYEEIKNERKEINQKIENIIRNEPSLLNEYYLNKLDIQSGGAIKKFTADTADKLNQLDTLFNKLATTPGIDPAQIQTKTQEILNLVGTISGTTEVKDIYNKIPQKLEAIKIDLEGFNNGVQIYPQLAKLYAPLDVEKPAGLMNSSALNDELKKFKDQLTQIENAPAGSDIQTDLVRIRGEIDTLKTNLNTTKIQLETINTTLETKISEFTESLKVTVNKTDLKFVSSDSDFLKELQEYKNSKGASINPELGILIDKIEYVSGKHQLKNKGNMYDFNVKYNEIVSKFKDEQLTYDSKKLDKYRYMGTDTKTIANNMIRDPSNITNVMSSVNDLLKIKLEDELDGQSLKKPTFDQIYKPLFTGGADTDVTAVQNLMGELTTEATSYRSEYKKYVKNTEIYNKFAIYDIMHSIYLLSILSSSLFVKSSFQVYKYIGRGMINFYKRIIDKIYKEISYSNEALVIVGTTQEQKIIIQELRKKYYIVILKLKNFLESLSKQLSPKDIIDIEKCTELKILENFLLLNHFKGILEKYNEAQMNKLTIYGRINDIKMENKIGSNIIPIVSIDLEKYENLQSTDIDKIKGKSNYSETVNFSIDNKLFISDYDRRNIYAGYYIINNTDTGNLYDLNKNKLLEKELRPFHVCNKFADSKTVNPIYDEDLYNLYERIKQIFYKTDINDKKKIEELENIKKIDLSNKVKKMYEKIIDTKEKIKKINNKISELEEEIENVKGYIEDVVEDKTTNKDSRKKKIESQIKKFSFDSVDYPDPKDTSKNIIVKPLEKLLDEEKKKLTDISNPNFADEEQVKKNDNDINQILKVMKYALEYLYATSSDPNEKLLWVRNFTCDAQKKDCLIDDPDLSYIYKQPTRHPDTPKLCNIKAPEQTPLLNGYKFTEVFDTQNFPNNSDMAAYMCLNSRLTSGNGACLITYGYSGTGKSYTLFGFPGLDGLLQGTLNKLDGLDKIYFRLFEIYGKGIPYYDYWTEPDLSKGSSYDKTKLDKIYNYLYAYKLKLQKSKDPKDLIGITPATVKYGSTEEEKNKEWAVELFGNQINEYIGRVNTFVDGGGNLKEPDSYEATDRRNTSRDKDTLEYMQISGNEYKTIFQSFKDFTDKIEQIRIDTQRVRETPNNKVSSRSILIYDFVLIITIEGVKKPVNFLIIDLPGREEIAPTFINKYVDLVTNKVLYNIIKEGFKADDGKRNKKKPDGSIETYNEKHIEIEKKLIPNSDKDGATTYMNELKLMLACFTLNPLAVPIFATEIIEVYFKNNYATKLKDIVNTKIDRKYNLRGMNKNVFEGRGVSFDGKFKLLDEFYDKNYLDQILHKDANYTKFMKNSTTEYNETITDEIIKKSSSYSKDLTTYKFSWYTFHNLVTINDTSGEIKLNILNGNINNKSDDFNKWNDSFTYTITTNKHIKPVIGSSEFPQVDNTNRYVYGLENDKYEGRQIKSLLFIHLFKRIIELQRFDLLNDIFKEIIDKKINYYIEKYIDDAGNTKCTQLLKDLTDNNFKKEALIEKFGTKDTDGKFNGFQDIKNPSDKAIEKTIKYDYYKLDENGMYMLNEKTNTSGIKEYERIKLEKNTDMVKYLKESIKYDFYTTGFEGVYINENIIGLIKYLGKDGKYINNEGNEVYLIQSQVDREMINIERQNNEYNFEMGIKISNLLQLSRIEQEGKISLSGIDINKKIKEYGEEAIRIIDSGGTATANALAAELAKRKSARQEKTGSAAIMENIPSSHKYNELRKLKIFDINKDKYYKQLFTKTKSGETFGDYYYDTTAIDEAYKELLKNYVSSKTFCYDEPIIKTILGPYLDKINDFKIFYLFGNYNKPTRELKCAQQYELLETTNNFIEAITR